MVAERTPATSSVHSSSYPLFMFHFSFHFLTFSLTIDKGRKHFLEKGEGEQINSPLEQSVFILC